MKNWYFVAGLLVFSIFNGLAQPNRGNMPAGSGSITGFLMDAESGQPVEYGNIVVIRIRDSSMVTGTVSDQEGNIILPEVPYGRYNIKVSYIGYEPLIIEDVRVMPQSPDVKLGELRIRISEINLEEISVSGEKPAIVNRLDKKVVNVEALLPGGTGTAVDVMQNVPSVAVDNEGNIALRGNSNVTILIDGRPSTVEGMSSGDILNSIPVSSIESVEIITNPSAKYDPEGTSGIVNIILKHKQESGYQTVTQANAGTGGRYNGSFSGNYRSGDWNFFGNLDGRKDPSNTSSSLNRQTFSPEGTSVLDQESSGRFTRQGQSFRTGVDWSVTETKTLTFSLNTRKFEFNSRGGLDATLLATDGSLDRQFNRESDAIRQMQMIQYGISLFEKSKTPDDNWNIDFNIRQFQFERDEIIDQTDLFPASIFSSQNARSKNQGNHVRFEGNISRNLHSLGVFESGFNLSGKMLDLSNSNFSRIATSEPWNEVAGGSERYDFNERIYAGYGTYKTELFSLNVLSGLRAEYTDYSLLLAGSDTGRQYADLFPSVHVSKELSPGQDIMVSYSRRIDRPGNRSLNPTIDYSDSLNLRSGNPSLRPQYINALETGHSITLPIATFNSTIFFRQTTGLISDNTTSIGNNVTFTQPINSGTQETMGLELNASGSLARFLRWNSSWSGFNKKIFGVTNGFDSETFTWLAKANLFISLPLDLNFQVNANYDSPTVEPQREISETWGMDMSLRREFLDGSLTATLRMNDVFDSRERTTESKTPVFISESFNKWQSQAIFFGLSWRITENYKARQQQPRDRPNDMDDF